MTLTRRTPTALTFPFFLIAATGLALTRGDQAQATYTTVTLPLSPEQAAALDPDDAATWPWAQAAAQLEEELRAQDRAQAFAYHLPVPGEGRAEYPDDEEDDLPF